mmetsp:Transcript_5317/g.11820  ORF Transcript_5317/g.11820 Transcript_5317/m.11820 type:complete len:231 (-) Transcript_5317:13-705(-)
MPSSLIKIERRLFSCPTTNNVFPSLRDGAITLSQYTEERSTVSLRDSERGILWIICRFREEQKMSAKERTKSPPFLRHLVSYISVTRFKLWVIGMIGSHWRRWLVIGASPPFDLILAKLLDHIFLVMSHEISIGSFVESPGFAHGNVFLSGFHQHNVDRTNGPSQQRSVDFIKHHAALADNTSGSASFENPIFCQRSICPSNETIVTVPCALAMTKKANVIGRLGVKTGE